ncbi:MAG: hypothetical protein LLG37_05920 [Spirochaetia bacterium]|nr:hypothetical protein [Spirochaetia bacterium]
MTTIVLVCVIATAAAIVTGTVFFIITMVQIKKTAREFEGVAAMLNMAAPLVNLTFLGNGMLAKITKIIGGFFEKKSERRKIK